MLKGSSIPDNAVIGYGSVVTRKFENENVIISGYAAKENKRDISWQH